MSATYIDLPMAAQQILFFEWLNMAIESELAALYYSLWLH